jgi:hypothetical protein
MATFHINPRELAHRLMAEDARENGTQYFKCANCGQPYVLGRMGDPDAEDWQDTTVCSPRCFSAYLAYLNNPEGP